MAGPPYSSRARYAPGPGLAVAAVGLVLVALSLFGLKWADADKGSFLDISSAFRDAGSHAADDVVTYAYVAWAGFVLLALTAVLALVSGLPLPRTDNSYGRIACAFVAGLALVLQVWSIEQLFPSDVDPEIGAWLGAVGYLLVVVGAVIGARRAAPVAAYPPAYPPAGYPAHH